MTVDEGVAGVMAAATFMTMPKRSNKQMHSPADESRNNYLSLSFFEVVKSFLRDETEKGGGVIA